MSSCVRCGCLIPANTPNCPACGNPSSQTANPFAEQAANPYSSPTPVPEPQQAGHDSNAALSWIIPINTPVLAVISSYCGLLSLAICFLGPIGVITGILAIRQIHRTPGLVGMGRCLAGILLGMIGSLMMLAAIFMIALG